MTEQEYAFSGEQEDAFIDAYVTALLWTERPDAEDASFSDLGYDANYLANATRDKICAEALDFLSSFGYLIERALKVNGYTIEQAGHDFALTRNGHGAGFWDRGLGEIGDELTEAAHSFGQVSLYLGDDNLIYQV